MELLSVWVRRNINRAIRRESPNQVLLAEKPKICVFYFRCDASLWLIVFIFVITFVQLYFQIDFVARCYRSNELVGCREGKIKDLIEDIQSVFTETRMTFLYDIALARMGTYKYILYKSTFLNVVYKSKQILAEYAIS